MRLKFDFFEIGRGAAMALLMGAAIMLQASLGGPPEIVSGQAQVINSTGLAVEGRYLNLHGVYHAPVLACADGARDLVAARAAAAAALAGLVDGQGVSCRVVGAYAGACSVQGRDLSGALIDAGWAQAETNPGPYAAREAAARRARRGMWACQP